MSPISDFLKSFFNGGEDSEAQIGKIVPTLGGSRNYLEFNPNDIFPDKLFPYKPFDIDVFLKSRKSVLIGQVFNNQSSSQIIDRVSKQYNVNPKLILVSLQREMMLISGRNKIPEQKVFDRALGFGCTDGGDITKYYGFENQITNGARIYRKWFDLGINELSKPIEVDYKKADVVPINQFTYSLYLYCPHIGWSKSPDYSKYKEYGNYLTWIAWRVYFREDLL